MTPDIQEMKKRAENATKSAMDMALFQSSLRPSTILALIEENERLHRVRIAAQEQLDYMDLCGDKGDLERNLRTALEGVKK